MGVISGAVRELPWSFIHGGPQQQPTRTSYSTGTLSTMPHAKQRVSRPVWQQRRRSWTLKRSMAPSVDVLSSESHNCGECQRHCAGVSLYRYRANGHQSTVAGAGSPYKAGKRRAAATLWAMSPISFAGSAHGVAAKCGYCGPALIPSR